MYTCADCQPRLLDDLYGLLEPDESKQLLDHLTTCPDCRRARAEAERVQKLLAAAARSEFPDVRFTAPAADVTPAARVPARRSWTRVLGWAVAAGLLLAAGGPVGWQSAQVRIQEVHLDQAGRQLKEVQDQLVQRVAEHDSKVRPAGEELARAQQEANQAQARLAGKLDAVRQDLLAKQLNVVVSGPAALQAGASNEYHVQTLNGQNVPTPAKVVASVTDQKGQTVYKQETASSGDLALKLPADLPLTPGRELFLDVVAKRDDGPQSELHERLPLLSARYVTHLTTDKPMYQPGEAVRFRSLTLDRFSLRPPAEDLTLQFRVLDSQGAEVSQLDGLSRVTANGATVNGPDGQPVRGIGTGEYVIPATAAGGEYTLLVRDAQNRCPEERRKFLVNQYQAARLNKELEWTKKSYGPGETVVANCKVTRAEGGPVADQPVSASAVVDGQVVAAEPAGRTDAQGNVRVRLTLPPTMERGEASLSVQFTDGGSVETLAKPIPVVLKKLFIDFYPEGGYLVAGVPNRVYFQARTTLGKPADLRGRVIDASGRTVTDAATLTDDREPGINQGMGQCAFTPRAGQAYRLLIDNPIGIEGEYKLPDVQPDGVALNAGTGVSSEPEPLRVVVHSAGRKRALLVGAYCRGRLLDHQRIEAAADQPTEVTLNPSAGIGGVTRVTVFEETGAADRRQLVPVAERLVYRASPAKVQLAVEPDKKVYVPGDHVTLKVSAADERGKAVPAVAMLGVVNKSVVTMADEKTARAMPTHFLLTSEVRKPEDLEHADVLLGSHPKAATALDLLLGTQGWRRFAEQQPGPFQQKNGDDAERLLVITGHDRQRRDEAFALEQQKVIAEVQPEVEKAQARLAAAGAALAEVQADAAFQQQQGDLAAQAQAARAEFGQAQASVRQAEEARRRTVNRVLPAVCAGLLAVAVMSLLVGLWRGLRYYVTAAGALGLAGAAAVLIVVLDVRSPTSPTPTTGAAAEVAALGAERGGIGGGGGRPARRLNRMADQPGMPEAAAAPMGGPAPAGRAAGGAERFYFGGKAQPPVGGAPAGAMPGGMVQRAAQAPPVDLAKQDELKRLPALNKAPAARAMMPLNRAQKDAELRDKKEAEQAGRALGLDAAKPAAGPEPVFRKRGAGRGEPADRMKQLQERLVRGPRVRPPARDQHRRGARRLHRDGLLEARPGAARGRRPGGLRPRRRRDALPGARRRPHARRPARRPGHGDRGPQAAQPGAEAARRGHGRRPHRRAADHRQRRHHAAARPRHGRAVRPDPVARQPRREADSGPGRAHPADLPLPTDRQGRHGGVGLHRAWRAGRE
jgi:hypothetical protein